MSNEMFDLGKKITEEKDADFKRGIEKPVEEISDSVGDGLQMYFDLGKKIAEEKDADFKRGIEKPVEEISDSVGDDLQIDKEIVNPDLENEKGDEEEEIVKKEFQVKKVQIDGLSEEINGKLYNEIEEIITRDEADKINKLIEDANDVYHEACEAEDASDFKEARLRYDKALESFINIKKFMIKKKEENERPKTDMDLSEEEKKKAEKIAKEKELKEKLERLSAMDNEEKEIEKRFGELKNEFDKILEKYEKETRESNEIENKIDAHKKGPNLINSINLIDDFLNKKEKSEITEQDLDKHFEILKEVNDLLAEIFGEEGKEGKKTKEDEDMEAFEKEDPLKELKEESESGEEIKPETEEEKKETEEFEAIPEKKKKQVLRGLANLNYMIKSEKALFFEALYYKLSNSFLDKDTKEIKEKEERGERLDEIEKFLLKNRTNNVLRRNLATKREMYKEEQEMAEKSLKQEKMGGIKRSSAVIQLPGRLLRIGRVFADFKYVLPFRHITAACLFLGREAEAAKRTRLKNEKVKEKLRIEDTEEALEEALRLYNITGKDKKTGEASAIDLEKAFSDLNFKKTNVFNRLSKKPEEIETKGVIEKTAQKIITVKIRGSINRTDYILNKIENSKKSPEKKKQYQDIVLGLQEKFLKDMDQMVSQAGTIDLVAYSARLAEKTFKTVSFAMIFQTIGLIYIKITESNLSFENGMEKIEKEFGVPLWQKSETFSGKGATVPQIGEPKKEYTPWGAQMPPKEEELDIPEKQESGGDTEHKMRHRITPEELEQQQRSGTYSEEKGKEILKNKGSLNPEETTSEDAKKAVDEIEKFLNEEEKSSSSDKHSSFKIPFLQTEEASADFKNHFEQLKPDVKKEVAEIFRNLGRDEKEEIFKKGFNGKKGEDGLFDYTIDKYKDMKAREALGPIYNYYYDKAMKESNNLLNNYDSLNNKIIKFLGFENEENLKKTLDILKGSKNYKEKTGEEGLKNAIDDFIESNKSKKVLFSSDTLTEKKTSRAGLDKSSDAVHRKFDFKIEKGSSVYEELQDLENKGFLTHEERMKHWEKLQDKGFVPEGSRLILDSKNIENDEIVPPKGMKVMSDREYYDDLKNRGKKAPHWLSEKLGIKDLDKDTKYKTLKSKVFPEESEKNGKTAIIESEKKHTEGEIKEKKHFSENNLTDEEKSNLRFLDQRREFLTNKLSTYLDTKDPVINEERNQFIINHPDLSDQKDFAKIFETEKILNIKFGKHFTSEEIYDNFFVKDVKIEAGLTGNEVSFIFKDGIRVSLNENGEAIFYDENSDNEGLIGSILSNKYFVEKVDIDRLSVSRITELKEGIPLRLNAEENIFSALQKLSNVRWGFDVKSEDLQDMLDKKTINDIESGKWNGKGQNQITNGILNWFKESNINLTDEEKNQTVGEILTKYDTRLENSVKTMDWTHTRIKS